MDEEQIHFEWNLTPHNAPPESKTGITFKGKDPEYIDAHRKLSGMFLTKGEQFLINGIEMRISDTPKNKPISIELKPKVGLSGKANLKIYDQNKRGGATIHITKVSGGDLLHSKILAFDVIKFLLDKIISGVISDGSIATFKKKSVSKNEAGNECKYCEKSFLNSQGLKLHKAKDHAADKSFDCKECASWFKTENELTEHMNAIHVVVRSPEPKKQKVNLKDDANAGIKDVDCDDMEIDVEIDSKVEDTVTLSKRNDEKILEKHKSEEKKEELLKEINRKRQLLTVEEERKRKRQISVNKKKRKKLSQKERKREIGGHEQKKNVKNPKLVEIDKKYATLFAEAKLDIEKFVIYKVKGDGACGATCTAIHCHRDEKLGNYVRRNTNEYIAQLWEYFKEHVTFPHTQMVGVNSVTFKDESEYLTFLTKNNKSGLLWMDHGDLQAVANMYQIKVHILTTNIASLEETKARWTHLVPDQRLKSFSRISMKLPDMWVLHRDEQHFDLIIEKNSTLAKEGPIESVIEDEKIVTDDGVETKNMGEDEEEVTAGYMGWQIDEEESDDYNKLRYKALKEAYEHLKKDHETLKVEYTKLKTKTGDNCDKNIKQMTKEVKSLKEDYKELIEVLKKETQDKTKAETEVKTLKDIFQTQKEINEYTNQEEKDEEMEIDEAMGEWIQQQKRKSLRISKDIGKIHNCNKCENVFKHKEQLSQHLKEHELQTFNCLNCKETFRTEEDLSKHSGVHKKEAEVKCTICERVYPNMRKIRKHDLRGHKEVECNICEKCENESKHKGQLSQHLEEHELQTFNCINCKEKFRTKEELSKHAEVHKQGSEVKCSKCEKVYSNMNKLRRHDWRSHREVECNICDMKIENRAEISSHRRKEHKMFNVAKCRFFPNCIDEEECFFQHEEDSNNKSEAFENTKSKYCPKGETCMDQSCEYNAANHRQIKDVMCRFQNKCNRPECAFKHIVERAAFLGLCTQKFKTK